MYLCHVPHFACVAGISVNAVFGLVSPEPVVATSNAGYVQQLQSARFVQSL